MSRVVPRILEPRPELLATWLARRAADPGYVGTELIAPLAAAWGRSFDAAEIVQVWRELTDRDPRGRPCMCGGWGCLPLWAALAFDGALDPALYATDAGWTFAYCYLCRKTSIPLADMSGQRGDVCSICSGDGLAPAWVTNAINCPAMSLHKNREAGMWFPGPCAGCGGWGRRWPGADSDDDPDEPEASVPTTGTAGAPLPIVVFEREGELWRARFGDREERFADRVGFTYLTALLGRPGEAIDVMDLVAMRAPPADSPRGEILGEDLRVVRGGDAGEMLDDQARREYQVRLDELETEIGEALATEDLDRAEGLERERTGIVAELSRAVGLRGTRRASDDHHRARRAVTKALRAAIGHIAEKLPDLGGHLQACVHTGLMPRYLPRERRRPGE